MKFGGAAVATPQHFSRIAELVLERKKEYSKIVIVVSAMGNTTDQLISLAKEVNPDPPRREYDMLVTVGERISISLLAMALAGKSQDAVSFTGSQSGIITTPDHSEARIIDVRPHRLLPRLEVGKVVIVAGFQGVSTAGEITTLGRGGSDTTAVALGIALGAERVEFYKDVPGIYDVDPKVDPNGVMHPNLTYEEARRIISGGARILHGRCLDLAEKNGLPLLVRSFHKDACPLGTSIFEQTLSRSVRPEYEMEFEVLRSST
jgi:aspartate kinase